MSDLIDRQILKADLLCGDNAEHDYCFPCKEILERIDNQPAVETHDKRTETHACDLIDRQAAIDEVARWEGYLDEDMIYCIQRGLKSVPSAQPDLSSYSDKLWRNAYERGKAEAEAEQHWILCSERLPEMTHFTQDVNPFSDDVLVTIRNEYGSKCLLIGFFDSQHGWLFSDQQPIDGFTWKPIAWQPLPDPYKKEGDRNE